MAIVKMILTNGFDPDVRVFKEAKYIASLNHKVEILCWDRESRYKDKPNEIIEGIEIKRFYVPSKYGTGLKQLKPFWEFYKKVKNYLKSKKYDILHCHDLDGAIIGNRVKGEAKIVFDMHEYYLDKQSKIYNYITSIIVSYIQNKADNIIFLNDKQKGDIKEKNVNKLVFLPNYPESEKFNNIKKTKSEKIRIGYAGYIRHKEPFKNLIKATLGIENIAIDIYGTSILGKEFLNLFEENPNAKLYGKYDHKNIGKIYNDIDIVFCVYVAANENDKNAFPNKFFESIISGTPIMVAKNTKMADFVTHHNIGYVVDGSDSNSIRNEIECIIDGKEDYNKKLSNISQIKNSYKWEEVIKNIDAIYLNCRGVR